MFQIDAVSNVPIYRQVLEQIRRLIGSGQLKPGNSLPSVRELALHHAVNPMTISKAYSLAENEGLLIRRRGKPMAVAERKIVDREDRLRQLEVNIRELIEAAGQLNLDEADVLEYIRACWRNF